MIIIAATILGLLTGGLIAKRRGGARADIAQYAFVYAVIFALAGLFASIALERLVG